MGLRVRNLYSGRVALLCLAALLLPATVQAQRQPKKPPQPPATSMLLVPEDAVVSLEIAEAPPADPARTPKRVERRHAITDLSLRLATINGEPLATILALPDGERATRRATLFTADLTLVINGRMRLERGLKCGAWLSDISLCRTDCDGGAFALVRQPEVPSLSLAVGRMPKAGEDEEFNEGFQLDACRDEAEVTLETTVVPRRTAKVAEIKLKTP